MLAAIIALVDEPSPHGCLTIRDRWRKAGLEEQVHLGQQCWEIMLGFWATHPA